MCESEKLQNVKGCPFKRADEPRRTHRGEGESPTPLNTPDTEPLINKVLPFKCWHCPHIFACHDDPSHPYYKAFSKGKPVCE
jgi:hypothetical protein